MKEKQLKYERFKQWFHKNGGYDRNIQFPTLFEPGNYIGISASHEIAVNSVILAVPKRLTIGVSLAKQSQLKQIIPHYQILHNQQDDDTDYNVLSLFLIMQKMKQSQSFYHPYLQLLDSSESVMDWKDQQINSINDPYINLHFVDSVRKQFQPLYQTFKQITSSQDYRHIFKKVLSKQIFNQIYAIVMTRGFGWGLPETMLVPYADFLNHSSSGVHHYVFDKVLEEDDSQKDYIKKKFELDLTIFSDINNKNLLPIDYEMNIRQKYILDHKQKLKELGLDYNLSIRMDPHITTPVYNLITEKMIQDNYEEQTYLSTDEQDNDSESDEQQDEAKKQENEGKFIQKESPISLERKYLRYVYKRVDKELTQRFTEPKPQVNSQFEEGVKFDWWYKNSHKRDNIQQDKTLQNQTIKENEKLSETIEYKIEQTAQSQQQKQSTTQQEQKYFIVASSKRIYQNEQIYNCYGRRSNRFLLIWYGFCFQNNKYDSVPFRVWSDQVSKKCGNIIYTKYITQKQYQNGIVIGNQRYNVCMVSDQFRLKKRTINYKLLSYLRYKYLKSHIVYRKYYKEKQIHVNKIVSIEMEIQVFLNYQRFLNQLIAAFNIHRQGGNGAENRQRQNKNSSKQQQIYQNSKNKQEQKQNESENKNTYHHNNFKQNQSRRYFLQILQQSNRDIIERNLLAVKQLLRILLEIGKYLEKQAKQVVNNRFNSEKSGEQQKQNFHNKMKQMKLLPKSLLNELYSTLFQNIISQYYQHEKMNFQGGKNSKQQKNEKNKFNNEIKPQNELVKIKINQKHQKLVKQLKIMVRQYFRLLSLSEVCQTLETEWDE